MVGLLKNSDFKNALKDNKEYESVEACTGWSIPCGYCDKRFSVWKPVDYWRQVADEPGFIMIGLKNKNTVEVVNILYEEYSMKKAVLNKTRQMQENLSKMKSKSIHSPMMIRTMISKHTSDKSDEDNILCAHWYNTGILPKFSTVWPGEAFLKRCEALVYSKQNDKWCYRHRRSDWKKSKKPISENFEMVQKCNFQSCEICDSHFTTWVSLSEAIEKDLAPLNNGLVMLSVIQGRRRTVLEIFFNVEFTSIPIRKKINDIKMSEAHYLREFTSGNPKLEVRWMLMKSKEADNFCMLFAHWYNADTLPANLKSRCLPGEASLNKNTHFVFQNKSKKWFYATEIVKLSKNKGKAKEKGRFIGENIYQHLSDDDFS